jgi:hypothetical protein
VLFHPTASARKRGASHWLGRPDFSDLTHRSAGAAAKLQSFIESGGEAIEEPLGGEESITLMAHLDAGATRTMPSALGI